MTCSPAKRDKLEEISLHSDAIATRPTNRKKERGYGTRSCLHPEGMQIKIHETVPLLHLSFLCNNSCSSFFMKGTNWVRFKFCQELEIGISVLLSGAFEHFYDVDFVLLRNRIEKFMFHEKSVLAKARGGLGR